MDMVGIDQRIRRQMEKKDLVSNKGVSEGKRFTLGMQGREESCIR